MSEKEKSKNKSPQIIGNWWMTFNPQIEKKYKRCSIMKDLLDELGIKRLPLDNHWYRKGAIIQLFSRISSEDEKGEDENE